MFVFNLFAPWQETFADAGDGEGGDHLGSIFVPPPNRIGYNRILTKGVSRRDRICQLMFLKNYNNVFNHGFNYNFPKS